MGKHLKISIFILLFCFSTEFFPQEKENMMEEVQDDLGNVSDAFQEHFFEALKQKAIENHEKAIAALNKCLEIDPSDAVVFMELGKNYNAMQRFSEAIVYLEKARKLVPDNDAVLTELYKSYFLNQEYNKALPVVEELKELKPSFSEDLANLYILNKKYEQALELLDELDMQHGNSNYRNSLRGQIYAGSGNRETKIDDLLKRIEENPEDEKNYLNLIFVYSEAGDTSGAFETAKKLQEINPSSELVHLALYKFYLEEDAAEEAVSSMEILLKSDAIDEPTKYNVLNDFLIFVAEDPSLEKELMGIVEMFSLDENNTKVFGELGAFFLEKNRREKALEFFERGLENDGTDFGLLVQTLFLQLEFEEYEKAEKISKAALEKYPSQPVLYLLSGTVLNRLKKFEEAEEILNGGLDYIIEDLKMVADFYGQLFLTYKGLHNEKKAAEFQQKAEQLKMTKLDE